MVFQQFLSCQITEEKITQLKQNPNQTLSKLNVFESCISKEKGRISEESKKKSNDDIRWNIHCRFGKVVVWPALAQSFLAPDSSATMNTPLVLSCMYARISFSFSTIIYYFFLKDSYSCTINLNYCFSEVKNFSNNTLIDRYVFIALLFLGRLKSLERYVILSEGAFTCIICAKSGPRKDGILRHLENKHFPGNHQCNFCDKTFNSINSLQAHDSRIHRGFL